MGILEEIWAKLIHKECTQDIVNEMYELDPDGMLLLDTIREEEGEPNVGT